MADRSKLPVPRPTPETQHFWDGTKAGDLLLQQCNNCSHVYFPPRPFCPKCGHREVSVVKASGKATLYSYVINHRPRPDMGTEPYAIAVVQLEEGPRMMSRIQTGDPEKVHIGAKVEVTFVKATDEVTFPYFKMT